MQLEYKIKKLINSHKEGIYYDFKKEYIGTEKLIKAIISLANCKYDGDRYLIIGVDEENNYEVTGLNSNNKKYTQAGLQDILDQRQFAGRTPEIKLETLALKDSNGNLKDVDVIIIKNTRFKPYYLLEEMGKLKPYVICTRHNDKNSEAMYYEVKEMWKEQLGLTKSKKETFKKFLKDCENWEYNEEDSLYYYKLDPDYQIYLSKEIEYSSSYNKLQEPFSLFYLDDELHIGKASFKIKNTIIDSCEYVYCDGFRVSFPTPEFGFSNPHPITIHPDRFYYYLLDSLSGLLAYMLHSFWRRGCEFPYIFFDKEEEKNDFSKFLKEFNEKIEVPTNYYPAMSGTAIKNKNRIFRNTDLDSLRRNKYIYEYRYKNLK